MFKAELSIASKLPARLRGAFVPAEGAISPWMHYLFESLPKGAKNEVDIQLVNSKSEVMQVLLPDARLPNQSNNGIPFFVAGMPLGSTSQSLSYLCCETEPISQTVHDWLRRDLEYAGWWDNAFLLR
jgi:hypothetical protein